MHLEPGWPEEMRAALEEKGCRVAWNRYQARVQAIAVGADGTATPGLDPRGGAVGFGRD